MTQCNFDGYPMVSGIERVLRERAPFLASVLGKQVDRFGPSWVVEFERDLTVFFGDDHEKLEKATEGYIRFAMDGMLLQKRFDKSGGRYEPKSYEQASSEVYQNETYMFSLYLPGIYLSHFLWRHHYLQHLYFVEKLVPMMVAHGGTTFYDVGVGTGFYSREMLRHSDRMTGTGFDLSAFSLKYTEQMISKFGFSSRYRTELRNVISNPVESPADFLVNVEVLEHLEDPLSFLKALLPMLAPGGLGLITAAVTAPNADHIYLYNSVDEVSDQIKQAGFTVIEEREDPAYEPRHPHESVPRNAIVVVTRGS